jgi:light-harvesting complex II chlorophyll a/b binding protein 4
MLAVTSIATASYAGHALGTGAMRAPVANMEVMRPPQAVLDAQERLLKRPARWKPQEVAPDYLDGTLVADCGFDPLCLVALAKSPQDGPWTVEERQAVMANMSPADSASAVAWMREAELKHSRMAMLAVVGWPLAELFNPLASTNGRAPALFNGGLGEVLPFVLLVAGFAAFQEMKKVEGGDFGFDPLGLSAQEGAYQQKLYRSSELFNGRLAMLAITGFAVQEFLWQKPVVAQTPFFFGR